jgi:hypothetical protein
MAAKTGSICSDASSSTPAAPIEKTPTLTNLPGTRSSVKPVPIRPIILEMPRMDATVAASPTSIPWSRARGIRWDTKPLSPSMPRSEIDKSSQKRPSLSASFKLGASTRSASVPCVSMAGLSARSRSTSQSTGEKAIAHAEGGVAVALTPPSQRQSLRTEAPAPLPGRRRRVRYPSQGRAGPRNWRRRASEAPPEWLRSLRRPRSHKGATIPRCFRSACCPQRTRCRRRACWRLRREPRRPCPRCGRRSRTSGTWRWRRSHGERKICPVAAFTTFERQHEHADAVSDDRRHRGARSR